MRCATDKRRSKAPVAAQWHALAASQTLVSASGQFAATTDIVGTGTLTISLGSWNAGQTAFTPKTGAQSVSITIDSTSNTLAGVRDKINAANAGVTATIVTDSTGSRLALQSSSTGAVNGFKVAVTETGAAGLGRLAFDPSVNIRQMTQTTAAADTQATVNGIAITSSSTTLSNVIQGLTLTLGKVTTAPVQVTVSAKSRTHRTARPPRPAKGELQESLRRVASCRIREARRRRVGTARSLPPPMSRLFPRGAGVEQART